MLVVHRLTPIDASAEPARRVSQPSPGNWRWAGGGRERMRDPNSKLNREQTTAIIQRTCQEPGRRRASLAMRACGEHPTNEISLRALAISERRTLTGHRCQQRSPLRQLWSFERDRFRRSQLIEDQGSITSPSRSAPPPRTSSPHPTRRRGNPADDSDTSGNTRAPRHPRPAAAYPARRLPSSASCPDSPSR